MSINPLKIVFAGTPEAAKVILDCILTRHEVILVLTQPDRPKGRGKKVQASPVKELALEHSITVLQPLSFKNNDIDMDKIQALNPDIIIVVAYGLILPQRLLTIPKLGCVNVHFSLLPNWRGAAPIQRSIINGDSVTGVAIMQMDNGLDTGDILLKEEIVIDDNDTSLSLQNKLASLGSKLILKYLNDYPSITAVKQTMTGVSYAHKIEKIEAQINWDEDATIIWRKIKAFNPAPGCYTKLGGDLIKIWQAKPSTVHHTNLAGTILGFNDNGITVACGDNTILEITELQKAGKNRQTAQQFYTGHANIIGSIFSNK